MGVIYYVSPLKEMLDANWRVKLLDELGIAYPFPKRGRYPSLREVREILSAAPDIRISHTHIAPSEWQIGVEGIGDENTTLECNEYNGDEDAYNRFIFMKGWETLVVRVLSALSRACGHFVVIADCGGCVVVGPNTDTNADWKWYDDDEANDGPLEPDKPTIWLVDTDGICDRATDDT